MDYKNLDETLVSLLQKKSEDINDKNFIKLSEAKNFRKVAFDMFKDHYDGLWKAQDVNGERYLVRASDPKFDYVSGSDTWAVYSDYDNANITLSYKNVPIQRFSSNEYVFNNEDIGIYKTPNLESVSDDEIYVKNI